MVAPVGVAVEAARAFGLLLAVFGVAAPAVGVLWRRVQTLQALGLVAAATGGRASRASRAVGAVTLVARCRQLAVR